MKKRVITLVIALVLMIVSGPRWFILAVASWEYYQTDVVCTGIVPIPPREIGGPAPILLYEVGPYGVITAQGAMYPGDEYIMVGDALSGVATLVWLGKDGANFTVRFDSLSHPEYICKWFVPIGDYR
jgi:hypothetical protein